MELKINELTKEFKVFLAVDHISHTFGCGVYGLLGVNGAGKTTMMRMLCTLLRPSSGTITWNGDDIFELGGEYRKILGYLPQDFGFYPDFTVYDYLLYIASIKGLRPIVAKKKAETLLNQVGLSKDKNKKMKKLSGGMKRRVGIAQAVLNDPKILILDEPTAGLDPNERIRFRNLISKLAENRIVLLSTHIVSDVAYISNEILLMKDGKIQTSGTTEKLIASMEEHVWLVSASKNEVNNYSKDYKISNVKIVPGGAELRIISKQKPSEDAILQEATLEDLFLSCFGEKAGDNDGEI